MLYNEPNKSIEEIFYKQIQELSSKAAIRTLDDFNKQYSGRCFL